MLTLGIVVVLNCNVVGRLPHLLVETQAHHFIRFAIVFPDTSSDVILEGWNPWVDGALNCIVQGWQFGIDKLHFVQICLISVINVIEHYISRWTSHSISVKGFKVVVNIRADHQGYILIKTPQQLDAWHGSNDNQQSSDGNHENLRGLSESKWYEILIEEGPHNIFPYFRYLFFLQAA